MNNCDSKRKCKCMKKVRNIEVTSYTYDPRCLANLLKNQFKFPQKSPANMGESNICEHPQSILGNNTCKYFFSVNEKEKVDRSKYELKLGCGVKSSLESLYGELSGNACDLKMGVGDKKDKTPCIKLKTRGLMPCKNNNSGKN